MIKINHKICCSRSAAVIFSIVKIDSLSISVTIIFVVEKFCDTCLKSIDSYICLLSFFLSNNNFWCSIICSSFLETKNDSLTISITDRFILVYSNFCCSKIKIQLFLINCHRQFRQFL